VNTFLAVLLGIVLIQCEWRDTYLKIFSDNSCCQVTCCIIEPDDQQEESPGSDEGLIKQCCSSCCYMSSESGSFNFHAAGVDVYFKENNNLNSFYLSDCFHPPETV